MSCMYKKQNNITRQMIIFQFIITVWYTFHFCHYNLLTFACGPPYCRFKIASIFIIHCSAFGHYNATQALDYPGYCTSSLTNKKTCIWLRIYWKFPWLWRKVNYKQHLCKQGFNLDSTFFLYRVIQWYQYSWFASFKGTASIFKSHIEIYES